MPASPDQATILHWATLTEAVNEMKSPNDFLMNNFFSQRRPVNTRSIEIDTIRRGRRIAPFVVRDAAGIMVEGRSEEFRTIEPPHIRIKRPMTPSELLNKRRAGSVIFPTIEAQQAAIREYMASEFQILMDDVTNSEEWLAANVLRGLVTYVSQDQAAFTITVPRLAAHTVTLTGGDLWTDPTSVVAQRFLEASELVNDATSLNVTDAVMGTDAADAFLAHPEVEKKLDVRRLQTGSIDLTSMFMASGALFLGEYVHGVRVWRYGRTVEVNGTPEPLIRADYVEFIANQPAAEMRVYYGAIEDMRALGEGVVLASPRFSKTWEEEDPSARMLLVESNPLPWLRRPEATVSMKVV